jgi:FdhE protein
LTIRSTWDERIERARKLEREYPVAADVLRFYQKIARFQKSAGSDSEPQAQELAGLLALAESEGPLALAESARSLKRDAASQQKVLKGTPNDPMQTFFSRVLRQPYAERAAANADPPTGMTRSTCPFCGERPVVAALRPEGDGSKRGLICSLCFTEWEFRRLLCPNCGEEDHRKLPVYKADEFPYVRAEACDSCRHYIKAVDLSLNGLALPEVDELAAIPLDLWAAENNYIKLQANILGL